MRLKNNKHEQFCQEYLVDLNGTQAAIRAGYGSKNANNTASRLLANAQISARMDELLAARSRRTGVNQDRVVRELARIAFAKLTDVVDTQDATVRADAVEDDLAVLSSVKVKRMPMEKGEMVEREVRLADKVKALELLGKHLGMYTDKTEIMASERVTIVDDLERENGGNEG